jgi:hypothetical protein
MFFQKKSVKIISAVLVLAMMFGLVFSTIAQEPYVSYGYDWFLDTYPVQSGYVVDRVITSNELLVNGVPLTPPLSSPQDVFAFNDSVTGDTTIFMVDTGNNRIVITDENFGNVEILREFYYGDDYMVENFMNPLSRDCEICECDFECDFEREGGFKTACKEACGESGKQANVCTCKCEIGCCTHVCDDICIDTEENRGCLYRCGIVAFWAEAEKVGTRSFLDSPRGIHVARVDGEIRLFIADFENERVIATDLNGSIFMEYRKPVTATYKEQASFSPTKVLTDNANNVYICVGIDRGAVKFRDNGDFLGYFGANRVTRGAEARLNYLLRFVLTREQMMRRLRPVPVEFSNFTIDKDQFIYTVTTTRNASLDIVTKLDPGGRNVFASQGIDATTTWGDVNQPYIYGRTFQSMIIDISVDDKGDIYIFDRESGKIFQYDKEGNLLFIFGGKGEQKGLFVMPSAIETLDNRVLALDSTKNSLTIFKLTEFGGLVLDAMDMFNRGLYIDSLEPWGEVLRRDANYYMAYVGMGNAKLSIGEFEEALSYFYMHSRDGYGRAFKDFRINYIRGNFDKMLGVALIIIGLAIAGGAGINVLRAKKKQKDLFAQYN